jgi:hypothetical protein
MNQYGGLMAISTIQNMQNKRCEVTSWNWFLFAMVKTVFYLVGIVLLILNGGGLA